MFPPLCPACLWKDVEQQMDMFFVDIDDVNSEGSLDFRCPVCKSLYTTGLISWEKIHVVSTPQPSSD